MCVFENVTIYKKIKKTNIRHQTLPVLFKTINYFYQSLSSQFHFTLVCQVTKCGNFVSFFWVDNSFYLKSHDQSNNSSGRYGISIIPDSSKPWFLQRTIMYSRYISQCLFFVLLFNSMFVSSSAPRTYTIYFKVKV